MKRTSQIGWAGAAAVMAVATSSLLAQGTVAAEEPLVLKPENTVILDRSVYAGRWLQYYLIRCVAKDPDTMRYAPDANPPPDRSAAKSFPLFTDAAKVPQGKNVLLVGPHKAMGDVLTADELKLLDSAPGAVLVCRRGNTMAITTSSTDNWYLAPVRVFLDKCAGVRLYAPTEGAPSQDELWLSMPKEDKITIGNVFILQKPYFAKTSFSTGSYKRNTEWLRMNTMVSEGSDMRASHTIIQYFNPDKYHGKHPELYPMTAQGARPKPSGDAWNPCLANADLAAQVAMESIRERMGAKVQPDYLSLGVMDCTFDCKCPVCTASMQKHNGSYSNMYYEFLNRVARQCQKEFPRLYLTAYLYSNVRTPPVGMKIEPNIVVDVVTKSYNWVDPAMLQAEKDRILSISTLGAKWITHDWDFSGVTARIYNRQWAAFLQWAAQNGMKGIYVEWSADESWYVDGARYWVLRQLLSDPYQDVDALWRQYCQNMYGPAAEEMYRFYDMFAEKHVFSDLYCARNDLPRQEMACFLPEDLAQQRRWLETAIARTKEDALIQKRLALVMRYFTAHELFCNAVAEPARLYHRFSVIEKATGINKPALAFYVNDDGKKLLQAIDYYDTKRTVAPDTNATEGALGGPLSYRANYSRALGTILLAIRTQALGATDLNNFTREQVGQVVARSKEIYRANLPAAFNPKRAKEIEALTEKVLWIPRGKEMPKIDGDLSDPAWKDAAELKDFTLADLIIPTTQGNETNGRIMRVGDHLVIGLTCRQPAGLWVKTPASIETGTRIWQESCCEFFFGPQAKEGEKPVFFQYIVNALGAYRGFQAAADQREGVQCAATLAGDRKSYTIEVALPLKTVKYDFTQGKAFSFTIMRQAYVADTQNQPAERLGWHPMFFTAHDAASRGLVFME